jgi:hypothetical protein
MGKSLNMNTLAAFLDCRQNTVHLFSGLYIENSPEFRQVNKYPVIYLSFRELDIDDYKWRFKMNLRRIAYNYLRDDQINPDLLDYFADKGNHTIGALMDLTANLYSVYGVKPYIIIDEYDKPIMDNIHSTGLPEFKKWITGIFGLALKDNPALGKAVLTGVTRIAKENMFSGLNNLKVYDVLKESAYDSDFSLTEDELAELVPAGEIAGVRRWYNNMRVGRQFLYNIYSVMNYLSDSSAGLQAYWSMSGNASLLASLLGGGRAKTIARMLEDENYRYATALEPQLNLEHLKNTAECTDVSFYTLAVQAGYMSFVPAGAGIYDIFIPNMEARRTWAGLFLDANYNDPISKIVNIFNDISDTEQFSEQLTEFASMALSYHDAVKDEAERVYHVLFFGLLYGAGYECESNREAGLGRMDILLKTPRYNAILEFKVSGSETDAALRREADAALVQIDGRQYWHPLKNSPLPLYKIAVACRGKKCFVKTVLHNF